MRWLAACKTTSCFSRYLCLLDVEDEFLKGIFLFIYKLSNQLIYARGNICEENNFWNNTENALMETQPDGMPHAALVMPCDTYVLYSCMYCHALSCLSYWTDIPGQSSVFSGFVKN